MTATEDVEKIDLTPGLGRPAEREPLRSLPWGSSERREEQRAAVDPEPIAQRLDSAAVAEDVLAACEAFAADVFKRNRATVTLPEIAERAAAFRARLAASPGAGWIVAAALAGEREAAGWLLEALSFAEAARLREERLAKPFDAELANLGSGFAGLTKPALRRWRSAARHASGGDADRLAVLVDRQASTRALLERDTRWRPPRRVASPRRMVAEAVDLAFPTRPRPERDRFAAALASEVLGLATAPEQVRELMKATRRERAKV